jgi:hypothetical protein
MANSDAAAVLRADIRTLVEEGASADQMFIGTKVMPVYLSDEKTGQFPKFRLAKGELLNDDALARQPTGSYSRILRTYENDNFACVDRGLEELIDDTYKEDVARYFDAEVVAASQVERQIRIGLEGRISAAIINATNFTATAAAVNYTEANIATINFVKDVVDAIGRLNDKGVIPNTIVMSKNVYNRTRRSTLFINYIRGNKSTDASVLANAKDVASVFEDDGITQVLVGRLPKNNAKKGQAYSATGVWADTHIWVGLVEAGDFMKGGAGRTLVWNKEGGEIVAETYRDEERRSDVARVRQNTIEKVIDGTAGELITTSYS